MAYEYDELEFTIWLESLKKENENLEKLLEETSPNAEDIKKARHVVASQLAEVQRLKPKQKTQYDYKPAIPVIVAAKMLLTRAENFIPSPTPQQPNPPPTGGFSRRIPEIQLTKFNGDITKFSSFIASFHMKFDPLPIPDNEKLQHLKENVSGDALKLIDRYELTDPNYARALEQLNEAFSSKEDAISALWAKLKALPVASNSDVSLQHNFFEIESLLGALEAHGQQLDAFPPLRDEVYYKYPAWLIHQACGKERLPMKQFQKEVGEHIKIRINLHANAPQQPKKTATMAALTSSKGGKPKKFATENTANVINAASGSSTLTPTKRLPTCVFCDQQHYSAECPKFKTLASRTSRITDRCPICLAKDHMVSACTREIRCYYCKKVKEHHSCLCPQQFGETEIIPAPSKTTSSAGAASAGTRTSAFVQRHSGAHCTALLTLVNTKNNRKFCVRALFDNGSNESYIAETAARRMGVELSPFKTVPVNVFHHDQPVKFKSASTTFMITNNNNFTLNIVADTAPQLPQEVQLFNMDEFYLEYPEYRATLFVEQGAANPIEMLIGSDYFYDLVNIEQKIKVTDGLYIISTPFGSILVGRQRDKVQERTILFQLSPQRAIEELCSLEAIGIRETPLTILQEEERALQQFYDNIELVNNRYQIRLPWRQFPPRLSDNFGLAIGRLKSVLRKFNKEMFTEYKNIIEEQLDANIIEEISDPTNESGARYYLPHHAVITPEKSTPIRIVFDGSAKTKSNNSINDAIYKGVNLLGVGIAIIIRFRLHRQAIASDIEKAFHQLLSHPDDRRYLMFIFVRDRDKPISGQNLRFFRFCRYVFGIVASPFVLQATTKHHLRENQNEFTKQIEDDLYVDGVITGFATQKEAENYYKLANELFSKCSMNLRKWASNVAELRMAFQQPDRSAAISILGLIWDQYEDIMKIKPITAPEFDVATLRSILSKVAQFYDPCGYFAPVSITAKIFLRELHENYQWDDIVNEEHRQRWEMIFNELNAATKIELQRYQCEITENNNEYEIHAFADASGKACACAVYLIHRSNDSVSAHLLFARTKLAKFTDIPKLELIAAYMAVKALTFVKSTLPLPSPRCVMWSDSTCILSWIENTTRVLPVFIQRRVDEIRNIPAIEKRYIAGTINPADLPSRGLSVQSLLQSKWFQGPVEWIKNPPTAPPTEPAPTAEIYFAETHQATVVEKYPFDINAAAYSDRGYLSLLCTTRLALRFISAFQGAVNFEYCALKPSLYSAQYIWLRFEQRNAYADVIAAIENKRTHPLVKKLNLYIDQRGLIRCAGRFCQAPLSPSERQPIILPKARNSAFTRLLIVYFHESGFHCGTGYTLLSLRRQFWLPAGRRAVYDVLSKCVKCRRYTTRPYAQPFESPLPQFRLDNTIVPFQHIGIDTCGPFIVQQEKRYCLVVTDLVIRAVDLEMLENMTTETIFLALRRIFARRSSPRLIISDNAPQFVALNKSFSEVYVADFEWKFLPEHSPWMGGVYERIVGLVKAALFRTFHNYVLNEPVLRTAFSEIASMLNSRPLTYVAADADEEILTPNHFLKSYFTAEIEQCAEYDRYWKQSNELTNLCWTYWKTAYLQYLRNQYAKHPNRRSASIAPKVGHIVLIAEKLKKRNHWHMGKIVQLNVSADGEIRSAKVRTQNGIITRPLIELCPLETSIENPASQEVLQKGNVNTNTISSIEAATPFPPENDDWDEPEISVEAIASANDNAEQTPALFHDDDEWSNPEISVQIFATSDDEEPEILTEES